MAGTGAGIGRNRSGISSSASGFAHRLVSQPNPSAETRNPKNRSHDQSIKYSTATFDCTVISPVETCVSAVIFVASISAPPIIR